MYISDYLDNLGKYFRRTRNKKLVVVHLIKPPPNLRQEVQQALTGNLIKKGSGTPNSGLTGTSAIRKAIPTDLMNWARVYRAE